MDKGSQIEILKRGISNHEQGIKEGNQRVRAYYYQDTDQPDGYSEVDQPPHLTLMERGIEIINFAATDLAEMLVLPSPEYEVQLLLYGVGMEALLNGIHLKCDPEDFIIHMENRSGETPSFDDSKQVVIDNLPDGVQGAQLKMAELTLEFIRKHRNNEVHFAFHRKREYYLDRLILEISFWLFTKYSDQDVPELWSIRSEISRLRKESKAAESSGIQFNIDEAVEEN